MTKRLSKLFIALALLGGSGMAMADHDHGDHDRHGWQGRDDHGRGDRDWHGDRRWDRDERRWEGRHWDRDDHRRWDRRDWDDRRVVHYYRDDRRYYGHPGWGPPRWARGGYYRGPIYVVNDYRYYRLRPPPYGYGWVRSDDGTYLLVALATGLILDLAMR